eukprot:SAG31_NODE_2028_length_6632_cov_16.536660_1_plen_79_part_10
MPEAGTALFIPELPFTISRQRKLQTFLLTRELSEVQSVVTGRTAANCSTYNGEELEGLLIEKFSDVILIDFYEIQKDRE